MNCNAHAIYNLLEINNNDNNECEYNNENSNENLNDIEKC